MTTAQYESLLAGFGELSAQISTFRVTVDARFTDLQNGQNEMRHDIATLQLNQEQMQEKFHKELSGQTEIIQDLAQHIGETHTSRLRRQIKDATENTAAHQKFDKRLVKIEKKLKVAATRP